MVYFGRFKDGRIVPEAGTSSLPDGTRVRFEPVEETDAVYRLDELAVDDDLPRDLSSEHDHYIYGTPKRGN